MALQDETPQKEQPEDNAAERPAKQPPASAPEPAPSAPAEPSVGQDASNPSRRTPDEPKVPTRLDAMDDALQKEIDEALGGASLEELADMEDTKTPASAGEKIIKGRVLAVQGDDVFVDIGARSEGVLSLDQFRDEDGPEEGQVVEVQVKGYREDEGLYRLSRQGAVEQASWDSLAIGQVVEGVVTGMNKGGLEMRINGIRAFMPLSQIDLYHVERPDAFLNQKLECMVSEADPSEKNLVVSRRDLLAQQAEELRQQLWETLEEGQTVKGKVRSIMPYGAFVDIGGADGLLHVSDMSYGHVDDPKDVVQEGQEVEVRVLKLDREEKRISLGLKQNRPDPWQDVTTKYPEETVVSGRVTRLADFGAFVELEPGVEGLVHIGEMAYGRRVGHPREVVSEGDMVKVMVLKVDTQRQRISLSLKRMGDDPWQGASVRWPVDSIAEGTVTRIVDFGAFVELAQGVEGLVHISELSDKHVPSPHSVVREGQAVQVKVLEVDEERNRISLSMKQASSAGAAEEYTPPPTPTKHRKRKKPLKGGLD